jgi:serine/threonine protein kinase
VQPARDVTPVPNEQVLEPGERLPVSVGEIVGGKYFIERILGIGGMGVVAAANHEELDQRVALKIMRAARSTPDAVDRFLREARAAVRLKSSHVAKILDVGTLDNGLPFMVMELLEGSDLASILERDGALPMETAVEYLLQACDAISEAHAMGIIHRDLKPENLFVTERRDGAPLVKVLDFGISKVMGLEETPYSARRAITHESVVMGSPSYMSPEQARSAKQVDARTDIWALGAILYEMVTGQRAFDAPTVADIFVKVLEKPPPPPPLVRPEVSERLSAIIVRCLEKDRDRRFASVDELARALEPHGPSTRSMSVAPMWEPSIVVDIDDEAVRTEAQSQPKPIGLRGKAPPTLLLPDRASARARRRRRALVAAALFGGMLAAGVGAAYLAQQDEPRRAESPVSRSPTTREAPPSVPPGEQERPDLAAEQRAEADPTGGHHPPSETGETSAPKAIATAATKPAARTRTSRPGRAEPSRAPATSAQASPTPDAPGLAPPKYRRTEW